jgi:hypothetical protein
MGEPVLTDTASSWWATRRLRYNVLLLVAAPVSGTCLLAVWWLFEARLPCLEVTLFSLMFGGLLFGVGLALANLCYYLGPLSEKLLRPANVRAFRRVAFCLGVAFSLLLVFSPVIGNLVAAAIGPPAGGQCS